MSVYVPIALRHQVREEFFGCCAYCRTAESLTVAIFELEHIVPLSAGGVTRFENLCLACPTCNRYKANRTTAVDEVEQEAVALFHPHTDDWNEHFTWSDDATRVMATTTTGRATVQALRINRDRLVRLRRMWVALGEHPPDFEE